MTSPLLLHRSRLTLLAGCALAIVASAARAEDAAAARVAIPEAHVEGVSPEAGHAVTRQLHATAARLGYRLAPERAVSDALPGARAPSPGELLAATLQTRSSRGLAASLGAKDGRYVLHLTLANADRSGPFFASDTTDAATLEATTDRLARRLLPDAPADADSTENDAGGAPATPGRNRVAVQTEGAFGLTRPAFYNHLLGARFDHCFPGGFALGGYLGYANLRGKEGRAQNVLPYIQLEYAIGWARPDSVTFPLRFGAGYLPRNGPILRLAAGPSIPLSETMRLQLDLAAPTFWVTGNLLVVSLDVAAELSFAL